jgi:hypothetical protein
MKESVDPAAVCYVLRSLPAPTDAFECCIQVSELIMVPSEVPIT